MRDIRRSKLFIGIMVALILLSFFSAAKERVTGYPEYAYTNAVSKTDEMQLMQGGQSVVHMDRLSAVKGTVHEVIMREQNAKRFGAMRFLIVEFVLVVAIRIVYRVIIRRFGCHMIALWQNIMYIHQIDGKKGNVILYT